MLVLWDIDGTLIRSHGAGPRAMLAAGRDLFGERFALGSLDMSGWLDLMIWRLAVDESGIKDADRHLPSFRKEYERRLRDEYENNQKPDIMPGVHALYERLDTIDGLEQGLLTGNFPETARIKIEYAGLDPDEFRVCAWGNDAESRRELVPIALDRHHAATGLRVSPERVVVIGDTARDIDCAQHNGCRCVAVSTGNISFADLEAAGGDLVVETLEDTDRIVDFILGGSK